MAMWPCLSAGGSPLENHSVSVRCHVVPFEKGTCLEMRSKHLPGSRLGSNMSDFFRSITV